MPKPQLAPPNEFDFSKPETFEEWSCRWERYRKSVLAKESEESQVNYLVYCMGEKAKKKLKAFKAPMPHIWKV